MSGENLAEVTDQIISVIMVVLMHLHLVKHRQGFHVRMVNVSYI